MWLLDKSLDWLADDFLSQLLNMMMVYNDGYCGSDVTAIASTQSGSSGWQSLMIHVASIPVLMLSRNELLI
jgi:hypothetical protein